MCGCSSGRFRRKGRRACEKATGAETVPAGRGQPLIVYGGLCLLSFDTERMGYAALYGGGEQFFFVDAAVFKSTGGDLYAISGAPYLMGVSDSSALDVRMADSMDSLICHELWHATENRILSQDYAAIDPDTWDALNPPGFTYCGDAALSNDLRQWTLYSCDPADVCFVDGYACVDAREDRARIMEYFMVHEDAAQLLIESPRHPAEAAAHVRRRAGQF